MHLPDSSSQAITIHQESGAIELHADASELDMAIAAWLHAKRRRSGSVKTLTAYRDTLAAFRALLHKNQLDLDSEPKLITLAAQGWAGQREDGGGEVAPATHNQRLAILSSFYVFAGQRGLLTMSNPIVAVERAKVQHYARAEAMEVRDVQARLKAIDRTTLAGQRDYALLGIGLITLRRLRELAGLRWADVRIGTTGTVTLSFRRAKGGKVMRDTLPTGLSKALLTWLERFYGGQLGNLAPDSPVWCSLSRNSRGKALSIQAIANICEQHLGTSKVHTLRHTGARLMEDTGAKVSDIQAKLGHESLATTGRYLAALRREENPHADAMARRLGLEE